MTFKSSNDRFICFITLYNFTTGINKPKFLILLRRYDKRGFNYVSIFKYENWALFCTTPGVF